MRMLLITWLAGWSGWAVAAPSQHDTPANKPSAELTIPYVPTRHDVVSDLLRLADMGKNDVVYDLGSGDGRIVIAAVRDYGARRAVGIEIDPKRIQESLAQAKQAGVTERVEFIHGDLFTNDFSGASVVVLYLGQTANLDLRPLLVRKLKPGTRVVSHQYGMGEWPPDKTQDVRRPYLGMYGTIFNPFSNNPNVPTYNGGRDHRLRTTLAMWVIPARVAGTWHGRILTSAGEQNLKLELHQRLSGLMGSFEVSGTNSFAGNVQADLWGDNLRFDGSASGRPYGDFWIIFDGHVRGDVLKGKLAVRERDELREFPWEAQRAQGDFSGTWEWPCASGPRSVQLRIERCDGHWTATYLDRGQEFPVGDFYDFGGGFYFTHLIGREGKSSLRHDKDSGWLIGEAVAGTDGIKGTIEFHPAQSRTEPIELPQGASLAEKIHAAATNTTRTAQAGILQEARRVWRPKRVTP